MLHYNTVNDLLKNMGLQNDEAFDTIVFHYVWSGRQRVAS